MPRKSNIKPSTRIAYCNNNFNCKHCDYSASNVKAVSLHMKMSHNIKSLGVFYPEKFSCELCKINFSNKKDQEKHSIKYHGC